MICKDVCHLFTPNVVMSYRRNKLGSDTGVLLDPVKEEGDRGEAVRVAGEAASGSAEGGGSNQLEVVGEEGAARVTL